MAEEQLELEAVRVVPEATASATVRVSVEGFEWLFTLRDFGTETKAPANLLKRIKWVNEQLVNAGAKPIFGRNSGKAAAKAEDKPKGWCPIHEVQMKRHEKEGQSWYSHKVDGEWCNGK